MIQPELVQWQRYNSNGMVECWLTHNCLDWMNQQDWSDKTIIMFGAGLGDAWLANKCKQLYVVERKEDWLAKAKEYSSQFVNNITYLHRPCNDSDGAADYYLELPSEVKFDIIINDDAYRTELCEVAISYFKGSGNGIFICDNFYQSFVWLSEKAKWMMEPFESLIFEQADHTDNDGVNKWKTAVFFIK